jgi:hypothetical protein
VGGRFVELGEMVPISKTVFSSVEYSRLHSILPLRFTSLGDRSSIQNPISKIVAMLLGAMLTVVTLTASLPARESISESSRISLIRGLSSEIAVSKVTLPRGKHGLYLDSRGKIDEKKAAAEMKENGAAVRPGMPVEITRLTFKPDRIVFEINHGGKSGRKWYQRIEIGVGGATNPITPDNGPVLAYGSWVSLTFPDKVPDLTVEQVKKMLGPVLDFDRHSPTVLYAPSVPPKVKAAIEKHEVLVGMDRDAVLSSKGPPDRKVREVRDGDEQEDWIYGTPPHVLFVTFSGDNVIAVRQY